MLIYTVDKYGNIVKLKRNKKLRVIGQNKNY